MVLKRAQYFLLCRGRKREGLAIHRTAVLGALMSAREQKLYLRQEGGAEQLSLFAGTEMAAVLKAQDELRELPLPLSL